jgi:hypothetical protein
MNKLIRFMLETTDASFSSIENRQYKQPTILLQKVTGKERGSNLH